ncbi:unnamed protein product, partial [Amoebophrya sp. A120]
SSSIADPKQADSRPHLPSLQERHFMPCSLCIRNYFKFNFDDFDPDTPILTFPKFKPFDPKEPLTPEECEEDAQCCCVELEIPSKAVEISMMRDLAVDCIGCE